MILDEMKIDILHAVFINKNFIENEENCNYEKYLLELINQSAYFRKKSNFEIYKPPESEANGECDCNSSVYKFDFKLLESTTRFQASRELTGQIERLSDGVVSHCVSRKQNTEMRVTILHAAIRNCSYKQLREYLLNEYEYGSIEKDIKTYVNLLNTKKNLFFLFPYRFSFKSKYNFEFAVENINIALERDFEQSIIFREKSCCGYDTFLAYIYEDNLIISKFGQDNKLQLVDVVDLFKSDTYRKLHDYTYW